MARRQRRCCAEHGVGQSSPHYWKRRLEQGTDTQNAQAATGIRLVAVKVIEEPDKPKTFARDVIPEVDRLFTKEGIDTIAEQLVESVGPVTRSVLDRVLSKFGGTVQGPS